MNVIKKSRLYPNDDIAKNEWNIYKGKNNKYVDSRINLYNLNKCKRDTIKQNRFYS